MRVKKKHVVRVVGTIGLVGLLLFSSTAFAAVALPHLITSDRDRILAAVDRFKNWGYSLGNPQVPEYLPGVPENVSVAMGNYGVTNCTAFGAWVLLAAFPFLRVLPGFWAAVNIWDSSKKWSGIDYLSTAFASPVVTPPFAPGMYFVQSWMSSGGGHVRLVEVTDAGKIIVREASQSAGKVREHVVPSYSWGESRAVRIA